MNNFVNKLGDLKREIYQHRQDIEYVIPNKIHRLELDVSTVERNLKNYADWVYANNKNFYFAPGNRIQTDMYYQPKQEMHDKMQKIKHNQKIDKIYKHLQTICVKYELYIEPIGSDYEMEKVKMENIWIQIDHGIKENGLHVDVLETIFSHHDFINVNETNAKYDPLCACANWFEYKMVDKYALVFDISNSNMLDSKWLLEFGPSILYEIGLDNDGRCGKGRIPNSSAYLHVVDIKINRGGSCIITNAINIELSNLKIQNIAANFPMGKMCEICLDQPTDVRFLPCHHIICGRCHKNLQDIAEKENKDAYLIYPQIMCPFCRTTVDRTSKGIYETEQYDFNPLTFKSADDEQKVKNEQKYFEPLLHHTALNFKSNQFIISKYVKIC